MMGGPFLGTLNISFRIIIGIQKGTILTMTHIAALVSGQGLGFRVWVSEFIGFGIQDFGCRLEDSGCRAWDSWLRFRV